MKVRNGFVSNSSTSSFILIGFKYQCKNEEESDKLYRTSLDSLGQEDYPLLENEILLGKMYSWSSDEEVPSTEVDFPATVKEIQNLCEKNGIAYPREFKIFMGTRLS